MFDEVSALWPSLPRQSVQRENPVFLRTNSLAGINDKGCISTGAPDGLSAVSVNYEKSSNDGYIQTGSIRSVSTTRRSEGELLNFDPDCSDPTNEQDNKTWIAAVGASAASRTRDEVATKVA